ncbi:MAG: TlpA family protein disulfide reductase [Xanthomonadales bacterium]|nr:TlpA family protein disulfide reductase [Gammaproteobacteria bacterium]MBT8053552.1 TlpA family protein disulfide reductase [Gammaproteobacteria bacterium]NND57967.1 TlpA family protein disulfide reductase [Xanthomonadales bacterium]NNK50867.1 TlpA family protein disulfide reductase [Xanthomonadales bacterium]
MKKHLLVFAVVALAAGTSGYFLARSLSPSEAPAGQEPVLTLNSETPDIDGLLGQRRPDFTLNDTQGNPVSASDFDGTIWLANFWATWCAPCVEEMPMLSQLHKGHGEYGFKVVGIALDDPERATQFAAELEVTYTVLVGKTDVVLTGRRFGNATGMLPFSVLVDASGVIRWAHLGALSREELRRQIQLHR